MKVNFLGDIGIFRKYEELGIDPFREVELPPSDLNIGNFEFISSDNRPGYFYDVQDTYSCSVAYLESLQIDKFDGLGLANNHVLDYGPDAVEGTMNLLRNKGITVFGYSSRNGYSVGEFERHGIRLAIIACVKPGRWSKEKRGFGPDSYDPVAIYAEIKKRRKNVDHVIVFPHWGTELVEVPDETDTVNARHFLDAGASAVIGHHPHISQGIETYGSGLIAYSLGSFIYVPEEELGYSKNNRNRDISICLSIDFDKTGIKGFVANYYRYDKEKKIPVMQPGESVREYADFLDSHIYDQELYNKQVKETLVKREWRSFLQRFKRSPFKTLLHYISQIKIRRLKKLFL